MLRPCKLLVHCIGLILLLIASSEAKTVIIGFAPLGFEMRFETNSWGWLKKWLNVDKFFERWIERKNSRTNRKHLRESMWKSDCRVGISYGNWFLVILECRNMVNRNTII